MGAKYYESELAYLREMGREFALVHPSTAGLLAEKGSDPDVERLLEGFAFLSARIRERIDDAVPIVVDGLMQLLLPHYLRPVPACSIIQYTPALKSIRGVHAIARGTRVAAKPLQGTACEFRTAQDVDLLPLSLTDVVLDQTSAARPVIRLRFETTEAGRNLVRRPEGIRLLLFGDLSLAASLYLWHLRHLRQVTVQCPGGTPFEIGSEVVAPVGMSPDESLIPWPTMAQEGYRYLQEYFTLPGKFLFIDIRHLDRVTLSADTFDILLEFERPPPLGQRIGVENFRLFCTPVVNLFEVSGDPIKRNPRVYEHLIRAAGIRPNHAEVYEVTDVVGIRQGQSRRRTYDPFIGFAHAADQDEGAYYTVAPTASPVDEGIDTYLSIVTPRGYLPTPGEEEVLSLELVCTNRSLPSELQLGEISQSPRGVSSPAPFRNIAPVTVPVRPKVGSELHWRLLSHMAIARSSLGDRDVLRALLALYNFQRSSSPGAGRANELKVESIRQVGTEAVTRLMGGAPVRGVQTRIEVDEIKLGTAGEAFLFGCILDEVFATHTPLNSFGELHLVLHPSKVELRWPARSGHRRIV